MDGHLFASEMTVLSMVRGLIVWWLNTPTVRMFRGDRLLRWATAALCITALVPLWVTPILPLVDMGSTIGAAGLLDDVAFGRGDMADYYRVNWFPIPYWTMYTFISLMEQLGGALFAAKASTGLVVLLLPIAVMRLLVSMERSPRLGLWAFLLAWDTNLYWGWTTFQLGMSLALYMIANIAELQTRRQALKLIPLGLLIALTHVHAVALSLTVGLALGIAQRPIVPAIGRSFLALLGCFIGVAPWLFKRSGGEGAVGSGLHFKYPPVADKISSLFRFTLDNLPQSPGAMVTAAAFLMLVVGPVLLGLVNQKHPRVESDRRASLFLCGALGLYLALPFSVGGVIGHWWTYPRFATYVLIGILLVPRPLFDGWRHWLLAPGILCAFALHLEVARQFSGYGEYVEPYLDIVSEMKPGSTFMPLDLDNSYSGTRERTLGQLHGYAAALTSSYDPHLFNHLNTLLVFRNDRVPPCPNWYKLRTFSMEKHGRYYDYIIVHPKRLDPLYARRDSLGVDLVREAGAWRLYEVVSKEEWPPSDQR
jgi:hypothetical protein